MNCILHKLFLLLQLYLYSPLCTEKYTDNFFNLYIEFHDVLKQTKFRRSLPRHTKV